MIDKLLQQSGYLLNGNNISYIDTPRVTGYFLVHIQLPDMLRSVIANISDVENILMSHVNQISLPTLTIHKENMDHLLGSYTKVPLSLDISGQSNIIAYENLDLDITNVLYAWKSCLYNSNTYIPIVRKKFGESLMNKSKTTITAYMLPQNFVVNPDNIAIIKFYGSLIDDINLENFGGDATANDVMKVSFNFSFDKCILLTKMTAPLLDMSDIYNRSLRNLLTSIQLVTKQTIEPHISSLQELLNSLQHALDALEATRAK